MFKTNNTICLLFFKYFKRLIVLGQLLLKYYLIPWVETELRRTGYYTKIELAEHKNVIIKTISKGTRTLINPLIL